MSFRRRQRRRTERLGADGVPIDDESVRWAGGWRLAAPCRRPAEPHRRDGKPRQCDVPSSPHRVAPLQSPFRCVRPTGIGRLPTFRERLTDAFNFRSPGPSKPPTIAPTPVLRRSARRARHQRRRRWTRFARDPRAQRAGSDRRFSRRPRRRSRSRPKKSSTSASWNGRSPLNGFVVAVAITRLATGPDGSWRRICSSSRHT